MNTDVKEYILKKKKNKLMKKIIIISIFIVVICIFILLKAPIFNIKKVIVNNNTTIPSEKIINKSNILDKNIFLVNLKNVSKDILVNPYIKEVKIKRVFPDEVSISVKERKASYLIENESKYYVLNEELKIMEILDSDKDINAIYLNGIKIKNKFIGQCITDEDIRKQEFTKKLSNILLNDKRNTQFTSLDINNISDIILYYGEVKILLGNDEKVEEKMNKILNILNSGAINFKKGYIDVSFKGNPVIYEEKSNTTGGTVNE
ncbi:cell division protein FtsQ/DivIB [Clostridium tarantellae]|uniref:FtsQ-type POTRA domain-containing protein n=1 Tax=Clostridium tarantellae TaxID=39493 RepID=A0A6I1MSX7_9CLOT|nr:FtsQ-type POTRA domain-containing protein [Clostridium tarantellae]MPQ43991.1 FtsQ-type POTRA domain-containing protein [Clostridium tarantellae]